MMDTRNSMAFDEILGLGKSKPNSMAERERDTAGL